MAYKKVFHGALLPKIHVLLCLCARALKKWAPLFLRGSFANIAFVYRQKYNYYANALFSWGSLAKEI